MATSLFKKLPAFRESSHAHAWNPGKNPSWRIFTVSQNILFCLSDTYFLYDLNSGMHQTDIPRLHWSMTWCRAVHEKRGPNLNKRSRINIKDVFSSYMNVQAIGKPMLLSWPQSDRKESNAYYFQEKMNCIRNSDYRKFTGTIDLRLSLPRLNFLLMLSRGEVFPGISS